MRPLGVGNPPFSQQPQQQQLPVMGSIQPQQGGFFPGNPAQLQQQAGYAAFAPFQTALSQALGGGSVPGASVGVGVGLGVQPPAAGASGAGRGRGSTLPAWLSQ